MAQWYYGNMSYYTFTCNIDCCRSDYHDTMYGHLFTDQTCGILPQKPCGITITVWDRCKNRSVNTSIRGQCCCANSRCLGSCSMQTRCNSSVDGSSTPIVELTDELFMLLHGDLGDGRVRVGVYV